MEGSTRVIFYISQRVSLDKDQVAAMFVGAKRAGLYPHSITTGLQTAQEVSQWALLYLNPPTDPAAVCVCVYAGPQPPHHLSQGGTPLAGCAASDQEGKGQRSNGGTFSGWQGATGVLQGRRDVCEWVASCVASEQLLV